MMEEGGVDVLVIVLLWSVIIETPVSKSFKLTSMKLSSMSTLVCF